MESIDFGINVEKLKCREGCQFGRACGKSGEWENNIPCVNELERLRESSAQILQQFNPLLRKSQISFIFSPKRELFPITNNTDIVLIQGLYELVLGNIIDGVARTIFFP